MKDNCQFKLISLFYPPPSLILAVEFTNIYKLSFNQEELGLDFDQF